MEVSQEVQDLAEKSHSDRLKEQYGDESLAEKMDRFEEAVGQ